MATLEKEKASRPEIIEIWNKLNVISNAKIPDNSARYAATRSFDLMQPAIKPLLKEREEIDKKLFQRDEKTGDFIKVMLPNGKMTDKLKDGLTYADYEREVEAFKNGDPIEFEVYKIKLSQLNSATIINMHTGNSEPIPPIIISGLLRTHIIDDFEESMETEEAEKESPGRPDIPQIPRKK
jgi:hypothetical protein